MNIAEDFLILRKQVSKDHFSDNELKVLFKENKFDVVDTLMVIEERLTGRVDYRLLETHVERSEVETKIAELRMIANDKDAAINAKKAK